MCACGEGEGGGKEKQVGLAREGESMTEQERGRNGGDVGGRGVIFVIFPSKNPQKCKCISFDQYSQA